jgi:hypothetical protein
MIAAVTTLAIGVECWGSVDEFETANGERRAANCERRTASGELRAANGELQVKD